MFHGLGMTKQPASCSLRNALRLLATVGRESLIFHPASENGRKSVVVSRHEFLSHPLKFYGRLEHHAICQLLDHFALDFLPWCLAWRIMIAAVFFQRRATFR